MLHKSILFRQENNVPVSIVLMQFFSNEYCCKQHLYLCHSEGIELLICWPDQGYTTNNKGIINKTKKCSQILPQGETKIKHGTSSAILHNIPLIIISPCILLYANIFSDTIWMNTTVYQVIFIYASCLFCEYQSKILY